MNPQLVEYMKAALASGQSREAITQSLVQNGWKAEDIQQGFANTVTPVQVYSASVPTTTLSTPTHSKLPMILGAVAVVAVLAVTGGLVWADQQVKNNEASIANTASTTTESVVLDDTTLVSSSSTAPKITGSISIDNKLTFTATQLSNLKTDLIKLYAKYNGQDKNAEPLKTQFGKELNAIFLKDLGVANVTTTNMGILLYPEIGSIMADIQKQIGSNKVNAVSTATPTSGLVISNLSYSTISVSKSHANGGTLPPPTFRIASNGETPRFVYWDVSMFDTFGNKISGVQTTGGTNDSISSGFTDGTYSYPYLFGSSDFSPDFFSKNGIDHMVLEFYVSDVNHRESNRLKFTFTK